MKIRKNSLYNGGIPPYSWYAEYIGQPLYKTARKIGLPVVGALATANIPGSLAHASGKLTAGNFYEAALLFGISEIVFTGIFYGLHKGNVFVKNKGLCHKERHSTLDNLIRDC